MTRKEHIQYIGTKYDFDCDAQNNALLCVIAGFIVDEDVGYARHSFNYWMPIEPPKEDA